MNLIECSYERRHALKKCIHQFERVITVLFVVDLASYNQGLLEESSHNSMIASLDLFQFVSNLSYFKETSIILLFSKVDAFRKKLVSHPLQHSFYNSTGGHDPDQAIDYLKTQFAQRGRPHDVLRSHIIGGTDGSDVLWTYRFITDAVRDIIIEKNVSRLFKIQPRISGLS